MDFVESSAKTVEDAIAAALEKLGASKDDVNIEVLEEGSKGFLGLGAKNAVVRAVRKFDPESAAKTFLKEIFVAMGLVVDIDTKLTDKPGKQEKQLVINLSGENMGVLIGKRGQTLDSLQYLVTLVVNKNAKKDSNNPYTSIFLDTENYRKRRKETLESLAHNLARKVKHTRRDVILEPMNPYERRIIHSALQNDRYVTTYSQGVDPNRNIVITLKKNNKDN